MSDQMNMVHWFEIPVNDLERAKAFYEHALGIEMQVMEMPGTQMAWFPMIEGGAGATGSLVKGETQKPSTDGCMVYFSVEDIEKTLEKVTEKGGKIVKPKMDIGDFGFYGHFEDSEGNLVGVHSHQ